MNRLVGMALGATLVAASPAYSCCLFGSYGDTPIGGGSGPAPIATAAPAPGPGVASAAPCPPAAPAVTYVDQCVTTYECVTKTRLDPGTVYQEVRQGQTSAPRDVE